MAHRDNTGAGPGRERQRLRHRGADRARAGVRAPAGVDRPRVAPDAHDRLPLDRRRRVRRARRRALRRALALPRHVVAVVNLDAIAGRGHGRGSSSPATSPLAGAGARRDGGCADRSSRRAPRPAGRASSGSSSTSRFPFSLYEQGPFVAPRHPRGHADDRRRPAADRRSATRRERLDRHALGQIGHATQALVGSLDQGLELAPRDGSYVYLGARIVRGWAIELVARRAAAAVRRRHRRPVRPLPPPPDAVAPALRR